MKISNQLNLYDKREDMLNEGETIPKLKYPLLTGDTITLSEVRSRFILVDFWALWCNDCQKNLPKLREVHQKYSHRGFQILQVSLDADAAALNQWYANDSIPWLVVADYLQWESPLLDSLSINSIPSNYLVDRNGMIRSRNIKISDLDEVLNKLLQ
jgi:peroxiredoxin